MKFTKMSLVAALLIGSSAFAIENTKVSGDVNVFYSTMDATDGSALARGNGSLFDAASSGADIGLNLNATSDLFKNDMVAVSAGAGLTVLTTLGLENNLVGNVWGGAHTASVGTGASYAGAAGGAKVDNAWWVNEAWLAITAGKSTIKAGRMALDTPLAFTETWSIEKNTFEAAVLINQDIPDTTLVAAYVGNGNGTEPFGQNLNGGVNIPGTSGTAALGLAVGPVVNANGEFGTYGTNGAYAVGAINNSWKPLTVQAWYYDVSRVATAYWLQADLNIEGIMVGAQYVSATLDDDMGASGTVFADASQTYAVMAGYEMKDMFTAKVSYSSVDSKGLVGAANTATSTGASKLYTEAWWAYGYVTQLDTQSYNVSVTSPVNGIVDLGLYYTNADQASFVNAVAANNDMTEITATVGKSFGPLDATLVYSNIDAKNLNIGANGQSSAFNQVQVYLTVNF